jgi:hypothetical protein
LFPGGLKEGLSELYSTFIHKPTPWMILNMSFEFAVHFGHFYIKKVDESLLNHQNDSKLKPLPEESLP